MTRSFSENSEVEVSNAELNQETRIKSQAIDLGRRSAIPTSTFRLLPFTFHLSPFTFHLSPFTSAIYSAF
jgi:hypothetical protein